MTVRAGAGLLTLGKALLYGAAFGGRDLQKLFQRFGEPLQARSHSRLDGPERQVQPLRDLRLRHSFPVREFKRLALIRRQVG